MTRTRETHLTAPAERRLHKSDPTPPHQRDKSRTTTKEPEKTPPVIFTDWASI
ncbi:hypothetical protein [Aliiroseovarius crassostreae]|uniref:hypothetical protein n=1 Tax=Aliiroseovarius crassostreae TaxID=154981 RepID=UPI003C7E5D0D